jgi:hypothetical protein
MLGTRPNLFTFVFVAVFFVTGVILISGSEALSQSAATVVAIANMKVGATPVDFKLQGQVKATSDNGPSSTTKLRSAVVQLNSRARTGRTIDFL